MWCRAFGICSQCGPSAPMGAEAPVKSQRREETLAFELIPLPQQQTPDSEFYALGRLLLKKS